MMRQAEDPEISIVESGNESTLYISGSQAMQGWERELMCESADLLCQYGSTFLEVGLGFGISAMRIAQSPNTRTHVVIEKYQTVIDLFHEVYPCPPPSLKIIQADFFDYIYELQPSQFDGIFFDPALPLSVWNDDSVWNEVMPRLVAALRRGGAFIPFFSTRPVLRKQYIKFFDRVMIERRRFTAYKTTIYTHGLSGDAFIQCFIKQ